MADPKYADLPGIDTSQPDVFETSDLPEEDQDYKPDELNSESVERIAMPPNSAYKKFKNSSLDAGNLDFSDRIGKYRKTGYDTSKTEYEMVGEESGLPETPIQKYQRLQHEIRELSEEVEQIKTTAKEEAKVNDSPVLLIEQVHNLQDQLHSLHLEKLLTTEPLLDLADPQSQLPKKLLGQLDTYKKMAGSPTKKPEAQSATDGQHMVYELYYKPEQAKFSEVSMIAELEQRLAKLETLVGEDPQKLSLLRRETQSNGLVDAVAVMQARTTLLDPIQLEHVDARLQGLLQRLNTIKTKKKSVEDVSKESRISELYDMMERWDGIAETLPKTVERLNSLQVLHNQALQFSQALSHLDTTQQQISSSLKSQYSTMKKLQDSFASNMAAIQANCASLDERLKKLKK
ncbi:dynactin subunit 2-like isoform X2 [Saccoglossus kowalevskii]|uniref:Dynactin subunit 2-like isoform X1 n=1 Tax=Saccoglossus kowalevskii TaxID=10224 RepID=A0ABM0GLP6_SACKO|nr:PREDICTED: dynactin subunit 2-like isoform X1 [Saccoglossus kowalevskii]